MSRNITDRLLVKVGDQTIVDNEINKNADLDKFRKAVLFMSLIANIKAHGKDAELRKMLNKATPGGEVMFNRFWNSLDKFD